MRLFKRVKRTTWWIQVEHEKTKNEYEVPLDVRIGGKFVSWLVTLPAPNIGNLYQAPTQGSYHMSIASFKEESDDIISRFLANWLYGEFYLTYGVAGDKFKDVLLRRVSVPKKLATDENIKRIVRVFQSGLKMASEIRVWREEK